VPPLSPPVWTPCPPLFSPPGTPLSLPWCWRDKVEVKGDHFELSCRIKINMQELEITENQLNSSLLFFFEDNMYMFTDAEDINVIAPFVSKGRMKINKIEWPQQLGSFIVPLAKRYPIEFDKQLITEVREGQPDKRLVLQEKGDYLVFQPLFPIKV
jgi:non-specific serine/threonine protein kinase